ncbi:hypothetical protein D6C86_02503 [Aureobasidium pullulans]|uniref:Uncharacterized protein n=1 Tax=Aureobasidium pullulans TaxID=5580 RepID=A0A4S9UE28_AURPU|nr:hypothetical protein D6C94_04441 [Aureobasidium pullulans]THZ36634.1 hypothetical protein D6C87_09042 [Aureobasidium pullulans]THZ64512.1 hypothetical protein D6C86_02503 [Aureobasidium pullulans]THZ97645.1 hypothetical protein D6C88_01166 [Aureobasidium pullulans]TIA49660.1 hypothetical protein D6C79_03477 [Aureobasidium pullulans]
MAPGPPPFGYTYHLRLPPNVRPKTNHTVTSDSFEDSTHYTRPPLNLESWVNHNVNTTPSDPLNNTQNSFLHFWVFPARAWLGRDDWLDFQYTSMFIVTDVTYILAFVSLLIQDKKSMPIDLEFGAYSIRLQAVLSERARAFQTPRGPVDDFESSVV